MPRTEHNKLVRDKIPDIIAKNGGVAHTHVIESNGRYCVALYKKFKEEFVELLDEVEKLELDVSTKASSGVLEELADMVEVVHAIVRSHGLTMDTVDAKRVAKRHERGGFEKRIYLEYVDEGEEKK